MKTPKTVKDATPNTNRIILNLLFCFQLSKVGSHQLLQQDVTFDSSGEYRCQITLSGVPFTTVQQDRNLSVIGE